MPRRSAITSASVGAIRATLEHLLTQPPGTEARIPCHDPREALSLRSRMNRLRATDRAQNVAVYAAANRAALRSGFPAEPVPAEANQSIFDELIFRVEGSTVVMQKAGITARDLIALAGLPPLEGDLALPPQPKDARVPIPADANYQGDHDTAPKANENPFA